MEFWGIEIKPGKPVTCTPEDGIYFHISQAALGESPKGGKGNNERIMVKIAVGKKIEVVIGTLVQGKCDQFPLDLIFDHEFTISHTGTSSHVFLSGYKSDTVRDDDSDMDDSEAESDEEVPTPVPVPTKVQGKADTKGVKAEKAAEKVISSQVVKAANQVQKEVTKKEVAKKEDAKKEDAKKEDKKKAIGGAKVEPPKDDSDDEEEDSDDDDDDDEDDDEDNESDDDEMGEEFSDMDDSDEEDSSDEEETPKTGDKKRSGLTGSMAVPADSKKMKTGTPFAVKPVSNKHEKASAATPTTPSTMKGQQNAKKFSAKKSPGSNNQKSRR